LDLDIVKLVPELADDYVRFFDDTPHDDHTDDGKCYCVCWCSDDSAGRDFSSREKRRALAENYVRDGSIQGYLAYRGGEIVGWCNANAKSDCLKCISWRRFMGAISTGDVANDLKVKSIFCFVIAPDMQRKGIAGKLLERVCHDAAMDGFDFVEAYPNREFKGPAEDFMGPIQLYLKNGFSLHHETERKLVIRKRLKG
jgi:GNAT superfamily N-acetyltransferase